MKTSYLYSPRKCWVSCEFYDLITHGVCTTKDLVYDLQIRASVRTAMLTPTGYFSLARMLVFVLLLVGLVPEFTDSTILHQSFNPRRNVSYLFPRWVLSTFRCKCYSVTVNDFVVNLIIFIFISPLMRRGYFTIYEQQHIRNLAKVCALVTENRQHAEISLFFPKMVDCRSQNWSDFFSFNWFSVLS